MGMEKEEGNRNREGKGGGGRIPEKGRFGPGHTIFSTYHLPTTFQPSHSQRERGGGEEEERRRERRGDERDGEDRLSRPLSFH